jgi:hypothetical protein
MQIDNSPTAIEDDADFIVVGSGCAGGTVARWLSSAGKSVIVVEEGAPPKITTGSSLEAMAQLYRDAGTTVSLGSEAVPLLQGKCLGGGSVINAAIQIRFPEWVWQDWVAADKKWERLLPWKELMDANDILDKELQIAETPPHLLGGNGNMMLKGFGDKAHAIRRNTPQCKGSGRCILGCPNNAKESTDKNYLATAEKNGARIYTNCAVKQVLIRGNRAIGVEGKFSSGAKFTARAKQAVILAASAIQTPWLLLRSGVKLNGNGFMAHPGASVSGLFDEDLQSQPQGTQTAEVLHYCKENIKFESMILPYDLKAGRVPGTGKFLQSRLEKIKNTAYWQVACKAEARGIVVRTPFGAMVFYSPTQKDRTNILRGISMMAEAMFVAGAKEVWPSVYGIPEVITTMEQARAINNIKPRAGIMPMAATHLFCGVTVREKFQVDGVDGLVVADSSFFPSNIGVNPMSSIMSAATLVAKAWM